MRTSPSFISSLSPHQIFVFGSNTEGKHGAGAARTAFQKFGAVYLRAKGMQGRSYAIITTDLTKNVRPSVSLEFIESQIVELLEFAVENPKLEFLVTRIGCELAGFEEPEIASLFIGKDIPENVLLPESFVKYLETAT